jgi:hypothetical protein
MCGNSVVLTGITTDQEAYFDFWDLLEVQD